MRIWGWLTVAAWVAIASEAAGEEPAEASRMSRAMHAYFDGELGEAAVFLGIGAGAGYTGGALIAQGGSFAIGASIPLLAVGAIQAGAGIVLLARTPGQVRELDRLLARDPAAFRAAELPRMERVRFWFDVYKGIEIGLAAVGAAGIVWGAVDDRDAVLGSGTTLLIQSATMLTLDLFADARADTYAENIRRLTPASWVDPATRTGGLAWSGRF